MRKGSDILGKPVVAYDTGERLEKIQDLIFDQHTNHLLGFLVDEGGWFKNARVLPIQGVQVIGPDAVIVPTKDVIISAERAPELNRILERNNVLKGTKIMTTDGRDLGSMSDLYFDESSGVIEGYDVSGGIFADAYSGRAFVPAPQTLKIGKDVAFVPPETATMMEEQVGGLKAAAQSAGEQLETATQSAGERLEGMAHGATVEQAYGRRAQQAVRTEHGLLIVAPGQIVTSQVIERAKTYHREQALMQAVNLTPAEAARTQAQSAGQQVGAGLEQARETAGNLWDRVKGKVGELQERSVQQIEQNRIDAAVGRPVGRVILDRQDNVILNVGELITHQAVERARQSGVLNMLLDSVVQKTPEISPEELRAPEPGSAALEQKQRGQD